MSTPETAGKAIERSDFGVKIEPVGAFLPNLWDMFMDVAGQISVNHESQDRVVRLVDALSRLPFTMEDP